MQPGESCWWSGYCLFGCTVIIISHYCTVTIPQVHSVRRLVDCLQKCHQLCKSFCPVAILLQNDVVQYRCWGENSSEEAWLTCWLLQVILIKMIRFSTGRSEGSGKALKSCSIPAWPSWSPDQGNCNVPSISIILLSLFLLFFHCPGVSLLCRHSELMTQWFFPHERLCCWVMSSERLHRRLLWGGYYPSLTFLISWLVMLIINNHLELTFSRNSTAVLGFVLQMCCTCF